MVQGVEFDEEQSKYAMRPPGAPPKSSGANFADQGYTDTSGEPRMIRWLIRHGYARTPAFGHIILLIVVVINAFITYFVIKNFL